MIVQGTPEWLAERAGHVTGSRVTDAMMGDKTAGRRNYMAQLAVEQMTGRTLDDQGFVSGPMKRGIELEPKARSWYMDQKDVLVSQLGFTKHPTIKWVGCSPDSEVEPGVGGVQIKCPNTSTHIDTLTSGTMGYMAQVQFEIWVMGWQWSDFVSYDDRMPEGLEGVIIRVPRDDKFIEEMELKVKAFLAEVAATVVKLEKLCYPR